MRDDGPVLTIPLRLTGVVALWLTSVGLMTWATFGGPDPAEGWALIVCMAAVAATAVHVLIKHQRMLRSAFEFGREVGREVDSASVTSLR